MNEVMIKLLVDFLGVVAEVLALRYLLRGFLGKPRLNIWQEVLLYGGLGLAFLLISTMEGQDYIRTFWYGAVVVLAMIFYPGGMPRKGLTGIFYVAFLVLIESAVYSFFVFFNGEVFLTGVERLNNYITGTVASKVLLVLLIRITVAFQENVIEEKADMPLLWFFLLLIMPVVSLIILYLLSVMALKIDEVQYFGLYLLAILLLLAANLAVFHLLDQLLGAERYKRQAMMAEQQLQQQTAYYAAMTEKNHYIRSLHHDMKNILLSLTGYLRKNEVAQALEQIKRYGVEMESYQRDWTKNPMLDTVIQTKVEQAKKLGCQLQVMAALPVPLHCDHMALAVVLANGLDNAIEAVQQLTEPDSRKIQLKLSVQNAYIVVQVQNPVAHKVLINQRQIKTTKADQELHGLGIGNMRRLAMQNGGDLFLDSEEDMFTLTVTMQWQQEN